MPALASERVYSICFKMNDGRKFVEGQLARSGKRPLFVQQTEPPTCTVDRNNPCLDLLLSAYVQDLCITRGFMLDSSVEGEEGLRYTILGTWDPASDFVLQLRDTPPAESICIGA